MNNLICILGHTAAGKTALAAHLASRIGGEVISADSRQVYVGMDIGTGKDIGDYTVGGVVVPCHLIDICNPGDKYNVFEFTRDFEKTYDDIVSRAKFPVLCGGSGLYLEAVLNNFVMLRVPANDELRSKLEGKSLTELSDILSGYRKLHNHTDTDTIKRAVRAIEIADFEKHHGEMKQVPSKLKTLVFGVAYDRDTRRSRITARLTERLENGMIEEARRLLDKGLSHEDMEYYGLEYKYLSLHLSGKLSRNEMFGQLNTAIHQFAKRQMTWFRRMERNGTKIHWIDPDGSFDEKLNYMLQKKDAYF